jgi:hypothetical protein
VAGAGFVAGFVAGAGVAAVVGCSAVGFAGGGAVAGVSAGKRSISSISTTASLDVVRLPLQPPPPVSARMAAVHRQASGIAFIGSLPATRDTQGNDM